MADSLNQNTRSRIDELCRKISVAHTLDREIQEELRGHMEDKLLAYLNGQEPLTEDDALLLVREHFGDPAKLKSMFQRVHVVDTRVSFARRLAAIIALYLVYVNLTSLVFAVAVAVSVLESGAVAQENMSAYHVLVSTMMPLAILIQWRVLRRWESQIRLGEKPWFQRWRWTSIATLLGVLACIGPFIHLPLGAYNKAMMPLPAPAVENALSIGIIVTCVISHALIWMWWCDRPPRLARTLAYGAFAWIILAVLPIQDLHIMQVDIYHIMHVDIYGDPLVYYPAPSNQLTLWQQDYEEYTRLHVLILGTPSNQLASKDLTTSIFACVIIACLALFIYTRLEPRSYTPGDHPPAPA